jgi:dolichol kinase
MDEAPETPPEAFPGPAPSGPPSPAPQASRKDLQFGRRGVHMANGVAIATAYALFFTHAQVIHLFGIIACLVYIADRVRMQYPELVGRVPVVNQALFRAEEQVKESGMTPYAIAILLALITFPKTVSVIAIYVLAIADPISAIVGIRFGRHRIVPEKSVEGSLAFFVSAFAIAAGVLAVATFAPTGKIFLVAALLAAAAAAMEMAPIRLDDNLTIPLFVGFAGWILCALAGIDVG